MDTMRDINTDYILEELESIAEQCDDYLETTQYLKTGVGELTIPTLAKRGILAVLSDLETHTRGLTDKIADLRNRILEVP
jgi:hypothetical protein